MSGEKSITDLEELMQHSGWIRNLAYASLRDYALAEDVSQEVLLKALAGPCRTGKVLKAWLAAVTCNTAKNEIRGNSRRRAREAKVAQRNSGTVEVNQLDIMQTHRELTYVVEALPPKHREIIVLRFYEEHSFRQIGALLNTSECTARVRLHRALQEMRNTMKQNGGDWKASCLLLAPAAALPSPSLAMPASSKVLAVISAVALIGAVVWWQMSLDPSDNPITVGLAEVEVEETSPLDGLASEEQIIIKRVDLKPQDSEAVAVPSSIGKETRFGRVFYKGVPVSDAEVIMWQGGQIVHSASRQDGSFDFQINPKNFASVTASAMGMARMVQLREGKPFLGPVLIHLLDPPDEGVEITVRDGETGAPIANAQIEVLIDRASSSHGPELRKNSVEPVAEGVADSEGRFVAPAWLADMNLIGRASAEGYAPNDCALRATGDPRIVRLFRGKEMPVQLVYLDGSPVADVELRQGERVREIQRTSADGYLPNVTGWGHAASTQKVHALPDFLFLRLPNDRIWFHYSNNLKGDQVALLEDRIQITVDDTPVFARLDDIGIPTGAWVEARSIFPYYASIHQDHGASLWERLEVGETAALKSGWTGDLETVQARLMPGKILLGEYEAKDGLVVIDQTLHHLTVTLDGPSVDAEENLELVIKSDSSYTYRTRIPFEDGVAELALPNSFRLTVNVVNRTTGKKLMLANDWGQFLDWHHIQVLDSDVEFLLHELASNREDVLIRMNGVPVVGGHVNWEHIDLNGHCEIPLGKELNLLASEVSLLLSAALHQQGGGPILAGFAPQPGREIPGSLFRSSSGQVIWDMELASVELLVPNSEATNGIFDMRVEFPIGSAYPRLQWPHKRRAGGWSTPLLESPSTGGLLAFRVPAGRYSIKIGDATFGGPDGVDFPAGQITQLHPDVVDPPPEGEG